MLTWDANLYLQFANERTQPSLDLVARIAVSHPQRIIDLGCGPGNSTQILRRHWSKADIIGLDNSPEMIAAASIAYAEGKWVLADVATWTADAPFDIVFSNATLHWVPNHAALFPHLLEQVAPHGVLAVQMPVHFQSPVHQLMYEIADDPAWRQKMHSAKKALVNEKPSFYYDLLQPKVSRIDIWETEYNHIMDSPDAIVQWISGTGLRPFLEALELEEQKLQFQEMLRAGVARAYPRQKDGRILFPFRRLFIVAYR
ncbi:trans-aconitate 2-methyltransferase [Brasilonema sp. UFV-L1]|uniref:trans-aconitate 2-methyltransferase n=1 Tax=Brasilonema sp. UFV-L1 TaxID=2234130 RepID=UPI00145CEEF6|nr:trans-aconitate 2-methyltransferase [Brasilonema sp. UFV-L1]NMG11754.1 trans-aconitate 2-methyltransferase [Brasilonema sp. UFV-L1]